MEQIDRVTHGRFFSERIRLRGTVLVLAICLFHWAPVKCYNIASNNNKNNWKKRAKAMAA